MKAVTESEIMGFKGVKARGTTRVGCTVDRIRAAACEPPKDASGMGALPQSVSLTLAGLERGGAVMCRSPEFRHAETFSDTSVSSCVMGSRIRNLM